MSKIDAAYLKRRQAEIEQELRELEGPKKVIPIPKRDHPKHRSAGLVLLVIAALAISGSLVLYASNLGIIGDGITGAIGVQPMVEEEPPVEIPVPIEEKEELEEIVEEQEPPEELPLLPQAEESLTPPLSLTGSATMDIDITATAYYDPTDDFSFQSWSLSCGSPSCTEHYEAVDDGVRQPSTPDTGDNSINANSFSSATDTWNVSAITESDIDKITLWVYGDTEGKNSINASILQGGFKKCYANFSINTAASWKSCEWNSPTGSLKSLAIQADHVPVGGGPPAEDANIYSAYLEVTYTDSDTCGNLDASKTLANSVSSTGSCFNITAANVVLDCAGYNVLYGSSGNGASFGVNISKYNETIIKNCNISEDTAGGNTQYGIYVLDASHVLINNTNVTTYGGGASGIEITNSQRATENVTVAHSTVKVSGMNANALEVIANMKDQNHTFKNSSLWSSTTALYLENTGGTLVEFNNITGARGLHIKSNGGLFTGNNTFVNNNITSTNDNQYTIDDESGLTTVNTFVYNNSFGEIRWVDNGTENFARNMTLNQSNVHGIGLGRNLFIGNNSIGLNTSGFGIGQENINGTADLTLYGLDATSVKSIIKLSAFRTGKKDIRVNGSSCVYSKSCEIKSYNNGILRFNTTSFSGFGGNSPATLDSLTINTTTPTINGTNDNITAYNTTADTDGDRVKTIYNWKRNDTSITVLNMPFEKVNGTAIQNAWDYSSYNSNGTEVSGVLWNNTGGFDGAGAYEFDGVDDQIVIPHANNLNVQNEISVEVWIRPTNPVVDFETIVNKGTDQVLSNERYAYNMRLDNGGRPEFTVNTTNDGRVFVEDNAVLAANTWYHIVGTYDGSTVKIYVNGSLQASTAATGTITPTVGNVQIGEISGGDDEFTGAIDEVRIYTRALSPEQVVALYSNRTNVITGNETQPGDGWNVTGYPHDGIEDGQHKESNTVVINTPPDIPFLLLPANGSSDTNRTLPISWNNSNDTNRIDTNVSYHLQIDDSITFNNPEYNVSGILNSSLTNTTHQVTTELEVDTVYYWRVRSFDTKEFSSFSGIRNFTVDSFISMTLLTENVSFGEMLREEKQNTTDGNPAPFKIENNGNININISINSTPFFSTSVNSTDFLFKVRNSEADSIDGDLSQTTYSIMKTQNASNHIINLKWQNVNDEAFCDLNITTPAAEPSGDKSATVTFSATG